MTSDRTTLFSIPAVDGEETAGFVVRGHNLGPIKDGWLVFIDDRRRSPGDHLIDQLCVVYTEDGQTLIRYLRKGRKPGAYDLLTVGGPQMLDVMLTWAEPVTWIRQYDPNGEEVAKLNQAASASS